MFARWYRFIVSRPTIAWQITKVLSEQANGSGVPNLDAGPKWVCQLTATRLISLEGLMLLPKQPNSLKSHPEPVAPGA